MSKGEFTQIDLVNFAETLLFRRRDLTLPNYTGLKQNAKKAAKMNHQKNHPIQQKDFLELLDSFDEQICYRKPDGSLLLWNESFAKSIKEAFGVPPYIGMKTVDFIPPEQKGNFIDQREKFQKALRGEKQKSEFTYSLLNGEKNHFVISWLPIWHDKKVVGVAELIRNISEQKEIENKIIKNEERYKSFIKNSSEVICCFELEKPLDLNLSVDGQLDWIYKYAYLLEANNLYAETLGYASKEEIIGFRIDDILPRNNPENIERLIPLISAQYSVKDFETKEVTKQGDSRIYHNNIEGIIEDEHLLRVWLTARDITLQKKMARQLQKSRDDFRFLAGKLISVQEEERRRLARELHDDLTQRLAILAIEVGKLKIENDMTADALSVIDEVQEKLIKVAEDINIISKQLHPSIIEDLGLEDALKSEINNFTQREGIPVEFLYDPAAANLSLEKAICLFRITQESLRNIAKHAQASSVNIKFANIDDRLLLTISDNGRGFDVKSVKKKRGLGLKSMRERVRLVRGTISYDSRKGHGANVNVSVKI